MKVKLEEIRVDSFATAAEPMQQRGTVNAHDASASTCVWSCGSTPVRSACTPPSRSAPPRTDNRKSHAEVAENKTYGLSSLRPLRSLREACGSGEQVQLAAWRSAPGRIVVRGSRFIG
jgi:hypothetical protein